LHRLIFFKLISQTIVNEIEAFDSWTAHPATPQLAAALLNALVFTTSSVATLAADTIFTRLIDAATGAKPLNHQSNNTEEYEVDPDHDSFGGEDRPLNLSLKRIKNAIAAKRKLFSTLMSISSDWDVFPQSSAHESSVSSTRRRLQEALTNDHSLNASDSNPSEDPQSRLKRARSVLAALLICHARHEAIVKVLLSERVEEITSARLEQVQSADLRKSNRSNSISQSMFVKPNLTAALSSALSTAVTTTIVPHFAWRSQYRYNASSFSDERWLDSLIVASIIPVKFWSQQFEKDNTTSKFPIFHRQELLFSVDFSVGSQQFSYAHEIPSSGDSHFVFTPSNTKTLLALANAASSSAGKQSVPGTLPSLMGGSSTGKRSMVQQFSRLAGRPLFHFSCKDVISSDPDCPDFSIAQFNLISSLSMVLLCTEGMYSSSNSVHSNIFRPWLCISDLEVLPPVLMSQFATIVQSCCISHDSRKHIVKGAFFLTNISSPTTSTIPQVPLPASLSTCLRCVQTVRPDLSAIFSAQLCASGFSRFADIGLRLAALFGDLNALNSKAFSESHLVSIDQKFKTSPFQHNVLNLVLCELMPRLLSARGPFSSSTENCEEDVAVAMCLHRMFCERLADSPMDLNIFDSALMRVFPTASRANFRDASVAWTALSMSHVDSVSLETNIWDGFAAETDPSSTALRVMLAQSAEQRYQAIGSPVPQISDPQPEIDLLLSSSSSTTSLKSTPIDLEGCRDVVSALVFLQNSIQIPTSSEWTQFLRDQFDSVEEPVTLHPLIHQLKRTVRPNAPSLKSAPRSIQISESSTDDKIHFRRIFSNRTPS
jgi:hypothetical protein